VPTGVDFGDLIVETDLDALVALTLQTFMPLYLHVLQNERGSDHALASPVQYENALEDDTFPDQQLPAVIITTSRTAGTPKMNGDGQWFAAWTTTVALVCRGRVPTEARTIASLYGGTVRRVLNDQGLGQNFEGEVKWTGSRVAPVSPHNPENETQRFLAAGVNTFTIYADKVLGGGSPPIWPDGPLDPYDPIDPSDPSHPYDPLAQVDDVNVTVIPKENE
jgi:hypothetical protein